MSSVVTGGAGFIGSHLVDALVDRGEQVLVIDNLATGTLSNLQGHLDCGAIEFVRADLLEEGWQERFRDMQRVYHLAADPDVRESAQDPLSPMQNNLVATFRVLEAMRVHHVPELVFTSTSTVYGDAIQLPTPEEYAPLEPISVYGATKLASEALISSYVHTFGIRARVYRFANIIGERSNHGVIWDFLQKLRKDPSTLEILGDGRQIKSYLEVHACVAAMLYAADTADRPYNVLNIGSEDWIDVKNIAEIVVEQMGLRDVTFRFTGGERGWVGDVPRMLLSVDKMKSLGWRSPISSRESVVRTVQALLGV